MAHFYTLLREYAVRSARLPLVPADCFDRPKGLRRFAPSKGLHPLRRYAAILAHPSKSRTRFAASPFCWV